MLKMNRITVVSLLVTSLISTTAMAAFDKDYWLSKAKSAASSVASKIEEKRASYNESRTAAQTPSQNLSLKEYIALDRVEGGWSKSMMLDYGAYTINYNCDNRGFNYGMYTTVPDSGDHSRFKPFHKESRLNPITCPSQKSTNTYRKTANAPQYHRGHGVHQNIFDHDLTIMESSNSMANVVPHNGVQNSTGLWRKLEMRIECARDVTDVKVWLGNDWGDDTSNDLFVKSHGVITPDYLWRVHVYQDRPDTAYAWLIPNDEVAKLDSESNYRVSLSELKKVLLDDYAFPIPENLKDGGTYDPYTRKRCSIK